MKRIAFLFLLMAGTTVLTAQTLNDVVNPQTPVTWLGLDFSLLKVVADQDAWSAKEPRDMFRGWNELMINEQNKYNVAKALDREQVKFALEVTIDHNAALPDNELFIISSSPEKLATDSDLKKLISGYNFQGNTGLGVMFVAQSFDKPAQKGYWWVTFVNLKTKEIVYVQKMAADAGGFGLRNYWASTVYKILKEIESSEFKRWKKSVKPAK